MRRPLGLPHTLAITGCAQNRRRSIGKPFGKCADTRPATTTGCHSPTRTLVRLLSPCCFARGSGFEPLLAPGAAGDLPAPCGAAGAARRCRSPWTDLTHDGSEVPDSPPPRLREASAAGTAGRYHAASVSVSGAHHTQVEPRAPAAFGDGI